MQPEWVVQKVTPNRDYTLVVEFYDGSIKKVDMKPLISKRKFYEPLKNVSFFMLARADGISVAWADKVDVAPEYLYEHGKTVN